MRLEISRQGREWVLLRDKRELGFYGSRSAASRVAELIAQQSRSSGHECELWLYNDAKSAKPITTSKSR